MKTDFIPIDYDYFDFHGKNHILIYGRNSKGERIAAIDTCPVYLWAILKKDISVESIAIVAEKIKKIKIHNSGRTSHVEKVEIHEKKFLGKNIQALKIFVTNYKDLHDVANEIHFEEVEKRRGYDLGFVTHYIIEKNIKPLNWYEISGDTISGTGPEDFGGIASVLEVDHVLSLTEIKEIPEKKFNPKILAYDIETDEFQIGEGEVIMVSLADNNGLKKVITLKKSKTSKLPAYVEFAKDEAELLEKFISEVKKANPDFLVGYFSDGFDLPYLRARAEKNKVKLSLNLDGTQPRFSKSGAGREFTGKTKGIVHIDLFKFIRTAYSQYMQSETMGLGDVAKEFLGESKKDFDRTKKSQDIKENEWEKYFEYNLQDSILTLKLFEKAWPDLLEFSRIICEPVSDISRNGMSKNVESYILHNLDKFNEIPEKRPTHDEISQRRMRPAYQGAFVLEPIPGLYENVAMFDFTASYGSTIVTYNLSKSTLLEKPEKNSHSIEALGDKKYFSKTLGFFPEMLKEIIELRKKYKKELTKKPDVMKKAKSNAFKLLTNSAYGYQGFFGARYYSEESAAATAAFARKSIKDVIEKINKSGFKTIYSDTDSIAFLINNKTRAETKEFLKKLNKELPGIMELELEGFFKRGLWVTTRAGKVGAKKKYALLDDDSNIKIRGFETVRRDWCLLARESQNKIINSILKNGNEEEAVEYLKEIIKKLKDKEIPLEKLIIRTQLKKPISEYRATGPHVVAAKKMKEKNLPVTPGTLIEYYIAQPKKSSKKKLVRERVNLPDEKGDYDIKYYLENQILPAVENILQVFDIDIKEIIDGKRQMTLGEF